mgnify:CR=1 FL=1
MQKIYGTIVKFVIVFLLATQSAWASPTGLNNIPTTDVVGDKTLVLQGWLTAGDEMPPLYMTGFKYGIIDKLEIGLDSKVGSGDAGPIALQGKFRIIEFDFGFSALTGTEGITLDDEIGDNIVPYLAISQDLKFFRLHGGYNFQKDNFGLFFGIDKKFDVFEQELILRSDLKQVKDGDNVLASGGILLTLPFNLVFETWISVPSDDNDEESFTVKLNYVFKF